MYPAGASSQARVKKPAGRRARMELSDARPFSVMAEVSPMRVTVLCNIHSTENVDEH